MLSIKVKNILKDKFQRLDYLRSIMTDVIEKLKTIYKSIMTDVIVLRLVKAKTRAWSCQLGYWIIYK